MATNKHAIIRYNILNKCFRNLGRRYYIDDLLEAVNNVLYESDPEYLGIQLRQLRDDIRFMKSEAGYAAPIEAIRDGKKTYYRYSDKKFSINNSPINATEAEQLRNAIEVLGRFHGAPQFEWINEIKGMLDSKFGLSLDKPIMSYDTNIDYSGYNYITPIFNAIVNKRVLELKYEPFNKKSYTLKFHPYYLKQYNNRWFAFGLNEKLNLPKWNLALDRITKIKESSAKYIDTNIDWEDHFYDIIGVTTPDDGKLEEVELIFSKEQANYVYTKPLHPTQKAKFLETGELKVVLNIILNYELEMLLLSFGEKVKVIKPDHLKKKIYNRLINSLESYS